MPDSDVYVLTDKGRAMSDKDRLEGSNAGSPAVQGTPLEDAIDREAAIEETIHKQSVETERRLSVDEVEQRINNDQPVSIDADGAHVGVPPPADVFDFSQQDKGNPSHGNPLRFRCTDDKRTMNNVMRHEYRELSVGEKTAMQLVKDKGLELWELFDIIGKTDLRANQLPSETAADARNGQVGPAGSRELSLAKTHIEEAVMWAVKHLTR